jgi:hypothetical protein
MHSGASIPRPERESDVYDAHNYEQDPAEFPRQVGGLAEGRPYVNSHCGVPYSAPYSGQPYFISEFGGIWWNPDDPTGEGNDVEHSWGYGHRVQDEEEFHRRFAGLTAVLLENPLMFGYCYTQLTDVFQEQNGIYRFDRTEKLDVARVRAAQQRRTVAEAPLPVLELAS